MYPFLADTVILDLTRLLPGPYGSLLLADLGAQVIKIEEPLQGDPVRWMPPFANEMSYRFALLNRNKKSFSLNLKTTESREIFFELTQKADIIFEGFRPGVVERLGIDYESIKKINKRIIYCSLSGYGQCGPYRDRVGHDINYIGLAGLLYLTGNADRPIIPGVPVADLAGGMFAALSMIAALHARDATGHGSYIDISMTDAIISWMSLHMAELFGTGQSPQRGSLPLAGGWPYYNIYETSDGKFLSLGALEEKFWQNTCNALEVPEYAALQFSEEKRAEIFAKLKSIFKSATLEDWLQRLEKLEIPIAPVNDVQAVFSDPQVRNRRMRIESNKFSQIGFPAQFSACAPVPPKAPPKLGDHTEEILKKLGYAQEKIDSLRKKGVI